MKILLTGATGFLGRHLLASLIERGHQVIVTVRASTDLSPTVLPPAPTEVWNLESGDLALLYSRSPRIDAVIHAATDYGRGSELPTRPFWANELLPMRLLELALRFETPTFINMDTFFNTGKERYDYLRGYTLSKRHFQEWGEYCASNHAIGFVNLRLFHMYGPGDNIKKFLPSLVRSCLRGGEIPLTSGEQRRDFIHVYDVVSAIATVVSAKKPGGYHHLDIGSGTSVPVRELVAIVNTLCGSRATLMFGALPTRDGEFQDIRAGTSAMAELGWHPRMSLQAGLQTVIDEARQLPGQASA